MISLKIRAGVYLDRDGIFIHVQLGTIKEQRVVLITGPEPDNEENSCSFPLYMNEEEDLIELAKMVVSCEYLGPL